MKNRGVWAIVRVLLAILLLLALLVLASGINHQIQLRKEAFAMVPIGQRVDVNGHLINVYTEGEGKQSLVFLSGGGTCSPVLDFKSLYSLLSERFRIVVVEKAGYGFSDDSAAARDIDTVLSETRQALSLAGVSGPFVLCPHSMSGIESLYWAQQYPQEVSAIIGLDMALPAHYELMPINLPAIRLASFAARVGITRWIPGLWQSDAIKSGTLTQEEKELYRLLFYRRTATTAMVNEVQQIKKSAKLVAAKPTPGIPILLFSSNGDGTGIAKDVWQRLHRDFIRSAPAGKMVELDCPHYVQDYEYEAIAQEITSYLSAAT